MEATLLWCNTPHHTVQPTPLLEIMEWSDLKPPKRLQNKCLHLITGAFKTTPSIAMEIEMSIPPIDLYLEYKPEVEALCLSWLDNNQPIIARSPPNHPRKLPDRSGPSPARAATQRHAHTTPCR